MWKKEQEASVTYDWVKVSKENIGIVCSMKIACVTLQIPGGNCVIHSIYAHDENKFITLHELKHCRGYYHP